MTDTLKTRIEEAFSKLKHAKTDYNNLLEECEQNGHLHMIKNLGGDCIFVICGICNKHLGWFCPKSHDDLCHYRDDSECCLYCGQPDERK